MEEQIMQIAQLLAQAQELLAQIVQGGQGAPAPQGQPSISDRFAAKAEEAI